MSKKYIVYIHISPSNHGYVGITCDKPIARWGKNGQGYVDSPKFWKAIKKYKWHNFKHIIVARGLSFEDARAIESYLVRILDTYENGYNCTPDGGGVAGTIQGNDLLVKRNKSRAKEVYQFTLDGECIASFPSARAANAITGVSYKHISACCCERRQQAGGFLWSFSKDGPSYDIDKNQFRNNNTKILQYDSQTLALLEIFKDLTQASEATGTLKPNICAACRGVNNHYANGYYWKYDGDTTPLQHRKRMRSKRVKCVETDTVFPTVEQAAVFAGTCATTITNKCRSGQPTANGYHFIFVDNLVA